MRFAFTVFGLLCATLSFAKCAINPEVQVNSANGMYRLVLKLSGSYSIAVKWNGAWKTKAKGTVDVLGHHPQPWIANDGSTFVVADEYAGVGVYTAKGRALHALTPEELLTQEELRDRPGRWPCHGEGTCLKAYQVRGRNVVVTLSSNRKVSLGF